MNETLYTIGELADAAGVTPRTIRYYTAEGLLPPPDTRGRHALYGTDHLRRLQLIARLKDAYLPLGEIRARLDQLTSEQVDQLLDEYRRASEPPAPSSAADYIAQVLTSQLAPPAPRTLAESPGYAESLARPAQQSMSDLRPQPASDASAPLAPAALPPAAAQPAPMIGRAEPAVPTPASAPQGGLLRKLIPPRHERSGAAQQTTPPAETGETWQRVMLAPGVELHLREPASPGLGARVERLLAFARELFAESPPP